MITEDDFGALRLSEFLPEADVARLEDWELLGHRWVGEGVGFTSFLALPEEPQVTRCIELHLDDLPRSASAQILARLGLGLEAGMSSDAVRNALGSPVSEKRFVKDRVSRDYRLGDWHLSTAVHDDRGLIFLTILAPLPS